MKSFDDIYLQNVVFDAGLKEVEAIIKVFINSTHLTFSDMCVTCVLTRAVDRILKSRIKSDLKNRIKSNLSDFLTGRKPLLLWSF